VRSCLEQTGLTKWQKKPQPAARSWTSYRSSALQAITGMYSKPLHCRDEADAPLSISVSDRCTPRISNYAIDLRVGVTRTIGDFQCHAQNKPRGSVRPRRFDKHTNASKAGPATRRDRHSCRARHFRQLGSGEHRSLGDGHEAPSARPALGEGRNGSVGAHVGFVAGRQETRGSVGQRRSCEDGGGCAGKDKLNVRVIRLNRPDHDRVKTIEPLLM
jgi:hypothetical protein